jgi:hypothetical protein
LDYQNFITGSDVVRVVTLALAKCRWELSQNGGTVELETTFPAKLFVI